jgi:hypothetical protein
LSTLRPSRPSEAKARPVLSGGVISVNPAPNPSLRALPRDHF